MKLERNKNSYQVMDKSIDEINRDLEAINFELGTLNLNQKLLHLTAACWLTASALNTMLYVKNNKMSNCILALIFVSLVFINIRKAKKYDHEIDSLYEEKDLLNEAKEAKKKELTR